MEGWMGARRACARGAGGNRGRTRKRAHHHHCTEDSEHIANVARI